MQNLWNHYLGSIDSTRNKYSTQYAVLKGARYASDYQRMTTVGGGLALADG
eukprot:SAG31_NODE_58_length_29669_cov_20.244978_23_plen_51_part_00